MEPAALRDDMVDGLEHALGEPLGERVLSALRTVPRRAFLDERPYANREREVAGSRALSPTTVARLLTALDAREGDEVLVVGAGVGYTAAALAEIVGGRHVHAVDIDRQLVSLARSNLSDAGYDAVLVDRRDGARGLAEYAPYDRVLVEAAAVEPPRDLLAQLADGGRLVFPRGTGTQTLVAVDASGEEREQHGPVQFDPLLVEGEQRSAPTRNRPEREDAELAEQGHFAETGWEQEWIDWDERL